MPARPEGGFRDTSTRLAQGLYTRGLRGRRGAPGACCHPILRVMERGQRPNGCLSSLLGFALALAGIALFFRGVGIFRHDGSTLAGTALLIVGAVCFVVANVWARRLKGRYSSERQ